jgi:AAA family ATP:ADP antiporter
MATGGPSFLERQLARFARIEPHERRAVLAAFLLFFFVLGSYFAVRPVRETIGTLLGRQRVADLWLYTALLSIAIVPVYGWLVAHVRRSVLLPCLYGAVALLLAILGWRLQVNEHDATAGTVFYVWISVLNLLLVSICWSFLLEMFSSEQSKRLFGFIAAGGTLGALLGPLISSLLVDSIGNAGVLYLAAAGFLGAIGCQRLLLGLWHRPGGTSNQAVAPVADRGTGGNPFAGLAIVLRSPNLVGLATFVMLLSAVNTFLYFEQLRIVSDTFQDTTRRTEVFATIDVIVQTLTICSQLLLTGRIASRLGVRALLTFIPVLMVLGFLLLAFVNVFATIAALLIARRWGEYSFIRPGREMLWSSLDTEAKYKANNFIDVPVYRAADYLGAQAKTAIDAVAASPAVAALIGAGVAALWGLNGWWLGKKRDALEKVVGG